MRCVMNAAKIAKYPSNQVARSQYIAVIVLRKEAEGVVVDRETEEILPRGVLVAEIRGGLYRIT